MHKLVVDTNVLIAALINPDGVPSKIFNEIIFKGEADMYLSHEVMEEYLLVIRRPKFSRYPHFEKAALSFLMVISELAIFTIPEEEVDVLKDQSDNKFLSLSRHVKADYLVTGNFNDFKMTSFGDTRILIPQQYFTMYRNERK